MFLASGNSEAERQSAQMPKTYKWRLNSFWHRMLCSWRLNPVWYRMVYSCTHEATVGVKGLNH